MQVDEKDELGTDETQAWQALEEELGDEAGSEPVASEPAAAADAAATTQPEAVEPDPEPGKPTEQQLVAQYQAAMREERAKRQAAEARVAEINEAIREAREGREREQAPPPSLDEDPVAFFEHQTKALQTELEAMKGETQREREERAQADQYQSFMTTISSEEQKFAQQQPDYFEAANHLRTVRLDQLKSIYPSTPQGDAYAQNYGYASAEAMRNAHLENEVITYSQTAMQTGQSPAAVFYSLAKQNGYSGNKPPAVTPQAKIDAARAGAQRATSLSGGSGSSGGNSGNATAAELADLYLTDPEAADALFNKLSATGALG